MKEVDVAIIGGGQAALACADFLKRTSLSYVILDAEDGPGGAWRHAWKSLRLFSPASWSSIAGRMMAAKSEGYPTRADILDYLASYEQHYALNVERPVWVRSVRVEDGRMRADSDSTQWSARAVISATGTFEGRKRARRAEFGAAIHAIHGDGSRLGGRSGRTGRFGHLVLGLSPGARSPCRPRRHRAGRSCRGCRNKIHPESQVVARRVRRLDWCSVRHPGRRHTDCAQHGGRDQGGTRVTQGVSLGRPLTSKPRETLKTTLHRSYP